MRAAVERAPLRLDPFPHAVVEDVFPGDFYAALVRAIPPGEFFGDKSRNKEHVKVPLTVAPASCRRVWNFLVYDLQGALQTLLVEPVPPADGRMDRHSVACARGQSVCAARWSSTPPMAASCAAAAGTTFRRTVIRSGGS